MDKQPSTADVISYLVKNMDLGGHLLLVSAIQGLGGELRISVGEYTRRAHQRERTDILVEGEDGAILLRVKPLKH